MSGSEISECVRTLTSDRVRLGPGTLYSILSTFEEESVIQSWKLKAEEMQYSKT